ncbi:MAG TPA: MaoC family dehydratase [Candidatus Dormibacteraeota bacterium]
MGQVWQLGSHRVTSTEILEFARQFDPQPFHVDPERARQTIFGGLIASGWHSASLWMRLYCDEVLSHSASMGSPGVDRVEWLNPVRPGDELRGSLVVVASRPSKSRPDRGLVQIQGELTDQDGVLKTRLTAWGLFGRRTVDPPP